MFIRLIGELFVNEYLIMTIQANREDSRSWRENWAYSGANSTDFRCTCCVFGVEMANASQKKVKSASLGPNWGTNWEINVNSASSGYLSGDIDAIWPKSGEGDSKEGTFSIFGAELVNEIGK